MGSIPTDVGVELAEVLVAESFELEFNEHVAFPVEIRRFGRDRLNSGVSDSRIRFPRVLRDF